MIDPTVALDKKLIEDNSKNIYITFSKSLRKGAVSLFTIIEKRAAFITDPACFISAISTYFSLIVSSTLANAGIYYVPSCMSSG